jgi:glycosyltransferase involved in cell wall biosynthesis
VSPAVVSVVTVAFNAASTLGQTIASIRAQTLRPDEYIVVDGGSSDGTQDLLRASGDIVTFWISERDKGISDAMNKGIALSRGKYIALIHADDWMSQGNLRAAVETLEKTEADFVFGDLTYHGLDGVARFTVRGDAHYERSIARLMPALNHPTIVTRRSVYEQLGLFDLRWKYAMDYEFFLRAHRAGVRGVYDPRIVSHMGLGGASDRGTWRTLAEVRDISIQHGYPNTAAWMLFFFRHLKGSLRRHMESLLGRRANDWVRKLVNRNIEAA